MVRDGRVVAYCSIACKTERAEPSVAPPAATERRGSQRRAAWGAAFTLSLVVLGCCGHLLGGSRTEAASPLAALPPPSPPLPLAVTAAARPSQPAAALLTLERDTWYHPLEGPVRRLPLRNTRRFGAPREGLRPEECHQGHCGVDLGSSKGESVLAVHDGVVERAVRDSEGREGRYVRLSHLGGRVVTSYLHLDRVRPDLAPGMTVRAGEPLGTVGQTGCLRSGPHLHFAVGIRRPGSESELFLNPEPLLQLWQLRGRSGATALETKAQALAHPHG